ncbi:hypothetical protein [Salibacterium qingdaonense]|uniref:hypothetical protein n=1 Tax=Salibacterium qingdaonense TaxID=266892 RepID=UPI000B84B104|nr:hypothetical protein [Salibacterium qingdaonense]
MPAESEAFWRSGLSQQRKMPNDFKKSFGIFLSYRGFVPDSFVWQMMKAFQAAVSCAFLMGSGIVNTNYAAERFSAHKEHLRGY